MTEGKKNIRVSEPTSVTSFSRKGTSFRSSLSFLSTNQLSMGIPLDSWKWDKRRVRQSTRRWDGVTAKQGFVGLVLPGRQRLEVSCQLLSSWRDPARGCWGLWCSFLEHTHSAHETACACRTHRSLCYFKTWADPREEHLQCRCS